MQDPVSGGVYRNVLLPGQVASSTSNAFDISLENNFSLYAGLSFLQKALIDRQGKSDSSTVNTQLAMVANIMKGLEKFFTNGSGKAVVYDSKDSYFYPSVTKEANGTYQTSKVFAVDVQTWGASVILNSRNDVDNTYLIGLIQQAYGECMFFPICSWWRNERE